MLTCNFFFPSSICVLYGVSHLSNYLLLYHISNFSGNLTHFYGETSLDRSFRFYLYVGVFYKTHGWFHAKHGGREGADREMHGSCLGTTGFQGNKTHRSCLYFYFFFIY